MAQHNILSWSIPAVALSSTLCFISPATSSTVISNTNSLNSNFTVNCNDYAVQYTISVPESKKRQLLKEKICSFGSLQDNWNGYGARKISQSVINKSLELLSKISYDPEIFPTGRDSIQFEYSNNDDYFEIEIFEDHYNIYFEKSVETKEEDNTDMETVLKLVNEFYE